MVNRPNTAAQRAKRHARVRGKISGTPERPRLCVFRSECHIYAQLIDDGGRPHAVRRLHRGEGV